MSTQNICIYKFVEVILMSTHNIYFYTENQNTYHMSIIKITPLRKSSAHISLKYAIRKIFTTFFSSNFEKLKHTVL